MYKFEHGRKDYEIEQDCPVCDGTGVIDSDNPEDLCYDYTKNIKVGLDFFLADRIEEIVFLANNLGVDKIKLIYQSDSGHKPTLFKVGEAILLTMPVSSCEDKDVVHEIKLI
jgi:hypothetical protein